MRYLILTVLAAGVCCPVPAWSAEVPAVPMSVPSAADRLAEKLQTGSLLFTEGDCLAVRIYTAGSYTHVAAVCIQEGQPIVYDSMNGVGVRKLDLEEYLSTQCPGEVFVVHPRQTLTPEQGRAFRSYLESQLGRPYSVHHHVTGQRSEGVHCSEYVTDALMQIEMVKAERPPKVSPASLLTGIVQNEVYRPADVIELDVSEAEPEVASNRCHGLWLGTKRCAIACCDKLSGWLICR
jgi:hypothetical protein